MFSKALILLAAATVALGNPRAYGPLVFPATGRIVGGSAVAAGEVPWQVSIQTAGGSQSCGGSIISPDWIVTAAHCSNINPSNYRVRAGTLTYGSGGTVHTITEVVVNADYNANTFYGDIAVWKVDPPFSWDAQTGPVALPAKGTETPAGIDVTVSGWGTTSSGGAISPALLKVDVPVVDKVTCGQNYANYGGIAIDEICAGESGKDSCQGDSGGPLYLNGVLHGIVSWGVGCARPSFPGVYTEVSFWRDWITTQTGV